MTAPVPVSATSGVQSSTSGTFISATAPATINAGDMLIAFYKCTSAHAETGTIPGFVAAASNTQTEGYFIRDPCDGTEGGTTITLTYGSGTGRGTLIVIRITGHRTGSPVDVDNQLVCTTAANVSTEPTLSPTVPDTLVLSHHGIGVGSVLISVPVSGFSIIKEQNTTVTSSGVQGGAVAATGPMGTLSWTNTGNASGSFRSVSVAIAPASGLTSVTKTWSTVWNVFESVTKAWSTQWNVFASLTKAWNTKWNVLATVSKSWNTKWNVASSLVNVVKTWSTRFNVKATATKAWSTRFNVEAEEHPTVWQELGRPYVHWDNPDYGGLDIWQETEFDVPHTDWQEQ